MDDTQREQLEIFFFKVDTEGLGYALTDYFGADPEEIQHDRELAEAWKNAHDAIERLQAVINERREKYRIELA